MHMASAAHDQARAYARSLWRENSDEMQASLNPCLQVPSGPVPLRAYIDETSHRAAGEVHGPCMWLRECRFVSLWPRAHDKVLIDDPTAHVTVHHKRESAEHPLLL